MASNKQPFAVRITDNGRNYINIYEIDVDAGNGGNYTVTDLGPNGDYKQSGRATVVLTSNKKDNYKRLIPITQSFLPTDLKKSLLTVVGDQADIHRRNYLKTEAISHLEDYKDVPGIKNAETQPQNLTPNPGSATSVQENNDPNSINASPITEETSSKYMEEGIPLNEISKNFKGFPKRLYYPETLEGNNYGQDYIEFTVKDYKTRVFTSNGLKRLARYKTEKQKKQSSIQSTIRLPIQGGIADNNNVNWGAEPLDAIRQAAGFASLTIGGSDDMFKDLGKGIDSLSELVTENNSNKGIQMFLQSLMARLAISSDSNFISRAFGAILNPNMELLFQNVELRPFSFRFDLTPRTADEAKQVRQIIRVFKQSMAARQGVADIFLATPMVYEIKYIRGNNGKNPDHPSINKIKTCALKSFNVNYTPNNQYMTYNDDAATMTSYSLDMTFQELEPVYFDDYNEFADDFIGY
jgi:hypothetical protein